MFANTLASIFESISTTMLGLGDESRSLVDLDDRVRSTRVARVPRHAFDELAVTAHVAFHGGFSGLLTASLSESLARELTSLLMERPSHENSPEDVSDAVGELVNIIAGNLRGMLPAPCQLSLPQVQRGAPSCDGEATSSLGRAQFRLLGEPMCIELFACAPKARG